MTAFASKSVFVTGAGSGIGYALVQAFAQEGAAVALNDIDPALASAAAHTINQDVGRAAVTPFAYDVSDVTAVRRAVDEFTAAQGRLDICIANAGLTNYGAFLDYTPEAFDRLTSVNLRGSYFLAQAAAKAMIARSIPGRILLLSSMTGLRAFRNLSAYAVTKAALRMMAAALALELGEFGITVNAIAPGATLTDRTLADDAHFEANWASVAPTGRCCYPEDMVPVALFLASPAARQVTGQTLVADGGWSLAGPIPSGHPDIPSFSAQVR